MTDLGETASKIYFFAYVYPGEYNEYRLSHKLGLSDNGVRQTIKNYELEEKGIVKIKRERRKGRYENRLHGSSDFLISRIKEYLPLDSFEEDVIRDKLDSEIFKTLLKEADIENFNFGNYVERILFLFDFLIVLSKEKGLFDSKGIETIEQYDQRKESVEFSFFVFPEKILDKLIQNSDVKEFLKAIRNFNRTLTN